MNLLINFSREKGFADKIYADFPEKNIAVLDFTGSLSVAISSLNILDIDPDLEVKKKARNKYVKELSELSTLRSGETSIRSFTFKQLPVYWLLPVSEKTSYYECYFYLYYYEELLSEKKKYFGTYDHFFFILDKKDSDFFNKIVAIQKKTLVGQYSLLSPVSPTQTSFSYRYLFSFYRSKLKRYKELKRKVAVIRSFTPVENINVILTYFPQTWRDSIQGDYVLNAIKANSSKETIYVPVFTELENILNWPSAKALSKLPSTFSISLAYLKCFSLYFKINRFLKKLRNNHNYIGADHLQKEFSNLLTHGSDVFLNITWFNQIVEQFSNSKFFYQDEVFSYGRIFSFLIEKNKNNNTSYGVMHGIYFPDHTSYQLTDTELNGRYSKHDGFPFPDFYLVWGDYFKALFLSSNSISSERVIVTGNINYLDHSIPAPEQLFASGAVLWCTGWWKDVLLELEFIKPFLSQLKTITVRLHPSADFSFSDLEKIMKLATKAEIKRSTEAKIEDEIRKYPIVLTQSHSSVFLDALLQNKPVIRLYNYPYEEIEGLNNQWVQKISSPEHSLSVYNNMIRELSSHRVEVAPTLKKFNSVNKSAWQKILN